DRDDDVLLARLPVPVGGLSRDAPAEGLEPVGRPTEGEDVFDGRHRGSYALDLQLGLPPAADHAERARAFPGQMLRGGAGRRSGTEAAELIGLDQRERLVP